MTDIKRQGRAVETAKEYSQGNIAGLDEAATRRLIASVVLTESNGGELGITNRQGYIGRYQAGAAWLADAGFIDKSKLKQAMSGYKSEWAWAQAGGMTVFLQDSLNWTDGLSLEEYKGSAEVQDQAFKRNSDSAYLRALRAGVLQEGDTSLRVAGFLKARHISGYGGAKDVLEGKRARHDENGTSNYDYYNDIAENRDGLDRLMAVSRHIDSARNPAGSEPVVRSVPANENCVRLGERGPEISQLQESLTRLGYRDAQNHPLTIDGIFGPNTTHALKSFQRAHHLHVDGIAGKHTMAALKDAQHAPLLSEATHPQHHLYVQVLHGIHTLPQGTYRTEQERTNAAVALTISAHVRGFKQIDHVVLGTNGVNLFAVQGRMGDPAHRRVHVEHAPAMAQPLHSHAVPAPQFTPDQALAMAALNQQIEQRGPTMTVRP
jgi:hypothetical protein